MCTPRMFSPLFFFNDTATTEIYPLSLHDALPISSVTPAVFTKMTPVSLCAAVIGSSSAAHKLTDRKSTRLNSSHQIISYAVFCLKKKKEVIATNASSSRPVTLTQVVLHILLSHPV